MIVALAAAATATVGCASRDGPDVAAVADRFHDALANGDGAAACARLAPETRSKLEQEEKANCEEAILEVQLPKGTRAGSTTVYTTSASVVLTDGGRMFLDQFAEGWKVSADGCRRT